MRTLADRSLIQRNLNDKREVTDLVSPALWISSRFPYDLDGSGRVETAYDQSGNGHDATQPTAGLRPHIARFEGRDWFDFSQGDHWLTTNGPGWSINRLIVAVVVVTGGAGTRRAIAELHPQWYSGSLEINASNQAQTIRATTSFVGVPAIEIEPTPTNSVQVVGSVAFTGAIRCFRNDHMVREAVPSSNPPSQNQTGWRIGTYRDTNDRFFVGYIGELLVVDAEFTDLFVVADIMAAVRSNWT